MKYTAYDMIKKKTKLSNNEIRLLETYLGELLRWNQKINLVGMSSLERIIEELLIDSLMARFFLPEDGLLLDIGSGAGFPAIPLKVVRPNMKFHLVEARLKKTVFLKHVIRKMNLKEIEVINGRVEEVGDRLFPNYDVVTFRGIKLSLGLLFASPYIKDGIIISFQGKNYKNALNEAKDIMEENKISIFKIKPYSVSGKSRALVIFKRSIS